MTENQQYHFSLKTEGHTSDIFIGNYSDILKNIDRSNDAFFITDENLFKFYPSFFKNRKYIIITPGEKSKSFTKIENIYLKLLDAGADRSSLIIGFGGGVVSDITGFIGSTFMRGIDFGFISTSLLGQVDAVIGGKNGVNLSGYKNIIGTFNQPEFIINDPFFFNTLTEYEYISGAAEVIKQFIIYDHDSFYWFRKNTEAFKTKDASFLNELIYRQNKIKIAVVQSDEKEKGIRKILNFGHTIGHAIERESGIAHGNAVAIGMLIEAKIAVELDFLSQYDLNILQETLLDCQLPVKLETDIATLVNSIKKDKKRTGNAIDFIMLEAVGKAKVIQLTFSDLINLIHKVL